MPPGYAYGPAPVPRTYVIPQTVYHPVTRAYTVPVQGYRVEQRTHLVPFTTYRPVTTQVQVPVTSYRTYRRTEAVPTTVYRQVHRDCHCGDSAWAPGSPAAFPRSRRGSAPSPAARTGPCQRRPCVPARNCRRKRGWCGGRSGGPAPSRARRGSSALDDATRPCARAAARTASSIRLQPAQARRRDRAFYAPSSGAVTASTTAA